MDAYLHECVFHDERKCLASSGRVDRSLRQNGWSYGSRLGVGCTAVFWDSGVEDMVVESPEEKLESCWWMYMRNVSEDHRPRSWMVCAGAPPR